MVDGQKGVARLEFRHRRKRHLLAVRGRDENLLQRGRVPLELGIDFENHMVLIVAFVNSRDLPLAERIVKRVVDQRG